MEEEEERMEERVEEEKMEERVEELPTEEEDRKCLKHQGNTNFLEDDRLLTALLESTSESRTGRIRGSFGTLGGRRRRRRELVSEHFSFVLSFYWIHFEYCMCLGARN